MILENIFNRFLHKKINKISSMSQCLNGFEKNGNKSIKVENRRHDINKNEIELNVERDKVGPPWHIILSCYLSFTILILFGYLREFLTYIGLKKEKMIVEPNREGYVPLYGTWENFFINHIYLRARDAFSQPISSVPAQIVEVLERRTDDYNRTFRLTGNKHKAINLGSYNYLGFAQNNGYITDKVFETIQQYGIGVATTHHELGNLAIHTELEKTFATFLNVESCVVFGMGFATNSTNITTVAEKGCLILGDKYNHASLRSGSYISGATYHSFVHNDMNDLEAKIRDAIVSGQPRTRRKWKKIIIIAEGVYSMEGSIANLPELIRLKKKYKCYLYVDEAHSIGAIGPNGKGITDFYGCHPNEVDLLMGTLTKSFGAAGGYIAGRKNVIDYIRTHTHSTYATHMSAPVAQQIISVVKALMSEEGGMDGIERIHNLSRNTKYFRKGLEELGFIVSGDNESPVVPIMMYLPAKIPPFVSFALKRGIATVGAGYPATSLTTSRIRFCMSAAHDIQMLDKAIHIISEIGDLFRVKYAKRYVKKINENFN